MKNIVILTTNSFPNGMAATNRILSYCKGFLLHNYQPEVICIRPTENLGNISNIVHKGVYNRINYSYPGGTTLKGSNFLGRRLKNFKGFICSLAKLNSLFRKREIKFVIFYGNQLIAELLFIFLSKIYSVKIFKEESENPKIYFGIRKNPIYKLYKWYYVSRLYTKYSGILAMTMPLKTYFIEQGIKESKILVVPHTIDLERFKHCAPKISLSLPKDYIAYLGPINQDKDGVLSIVKSFADVSVLFPNIHLVIAGIGTKIEKDNLNRLICDLNLSERIKYIGRIEASEIATLLNNSLLLVSFRKYTFQNIYSFPTKVLEYLATEKPVVTTVPGELSNFLVDNENAFVSSSEDERMFGLKIIEVLQNYDFAKKVGKNGKILVQKEFNPSSNTKKIIEFSLSNI